MNLTARTAVLSALDNFVRNYRIAKGEQERQTTTYHAYGFINTMTFDEDERKDFREIYDNKIEVRERAMASSRQN